MIKELLKKGLKRQENIKKEKLKEILSLAEEIIIKSKNRTYKEHPINALIKSLTDKVQQDFLFDLYSRKNNTEYGGRLFYSIPTIKVNGKSIDKIESNYNGKIVIARDNIISGPWNKDRFINSIISIGEGCSWGEWKEDLSNHFVNYYKPLNVYIVRNGNHSIACGILKNEGEIINNIDGYDLTLYYDYIFFDGVNYKEIEGCSEKIKINQGKEIIFEIGAIFEIGRLILKYKVDL
ncbi:MAG: DUF6710 family protein [Clostridium sp.]|uniref:DUF6710 family protein n=1 Tax=Clostridium sp. TaxID=1506 RepID=UPI002912FF0A|nr:DUF6710 family protein [Clostridium sp.]MDU7948682.1 DUF6710 family protein [Clostridium sp.]